MSAETIAQPELSNSTIGSSLVNKQTTEVDSYDVQAVQNEIEKNLVLARVETNFSKLPIWSLKATRNSKFVSKKIIELEPLKLPDGSLLERKIRIVPSAEFGYPTVQTIEYWYALQLLWFRNECLSSGKIDFSRKEIVEGILGKRWGKKQKQAFDLSLEQLANTSYTFISTFFDREKEETYEDLRQFHIISDLHLTSKKNRNSVVTEKCSLTLHPLIVSNLKAGYYKPVIVSVVSRIKSDIARLLYQKIDLQFSHFDRYEISSKRFFKEHAIEGKDYNFPSKRKRLLEKAIQELVGKPTSKEITEGYKGNALIASYEIKRIADGSDYKLIVHSSKNTSSLQCLSKSILKDEKEKVENEGEALELFFYFDKIFFAGSGASPTKRELEAVNQIIERYGVEKSRFLIEAVHSKISSSRYKPKSFLGILRNIGELETEKEFEKSQRAKARVAQKKQETLKAQKNAQRETFQKEHESDYHSYILDLQEVLLYRNPKEFAQFEKLVSKERSRIEASMIGATTKLRQELAESELRVFDLDQSSVARLLNYFNDHSAVKFPSFWEWAAQQKE